MCCVNKLEYEGTGEARPDRHLLQASGPQDRPLPGLQEPQEDRAGLHPAHPKGGPRWTGCPRPSYRLVHFRVTSQWHPRSPGTRNRARSGNLGPRTGDPGGPGRGYQRAGGGLVRLTTGSRGPRALKPAFPPSAGSLSGSRHASSLRPVGQVRAIRQQCEPRQQQTRRRFMSNLQVGWSCRMRWGHIVRLKVSRAQHEDHRAQWRYRRLPAGNQRQQAQPRDEGRLKRQIVSAKAKTRMQRPRKRPSLLCQPRTTAGCCAGSG